MILYYHENKKKKKNYPFFLLFLLPFNTLAEYFFILPFYLFIQYLPNREQLIKNKRVTF